MDLLLQITGELSPPPDAYFIVLIALLFPLGLKVGTKDLVNAFKLFALIFIPWTIVYEIIAYGGIFGTPILSFIGYLGAVIFGLLIFIAALAVDLILEKLGIHT